MLKIIRDCSAILIVLITLQEVNASITSRSQGGAVDVYQSSLYAATGTITGQFDFAGGLNLNGDGSVTSYYWDASGVVNGTFTLPFGYYLNLSNSLHLGPNAVLKSSNSGTDQPAIIKGHGHTIYFDGDNISLGAT